MGFPCGDYQYYDAVMRVCIRCEALCCWGIVGLTQCFRFCNKYFTHCMTLTPADSTVFMGERTFEHNATDAHCVAGCDINPLPITTTPSVHSTSTTSRHVSNSTLIPEETHTGTSPVIITACIMAAVLSLMVILLVICYYRKCRRKSGVPSTHLGDASGELEAIREAYDVQPDSQSLSLLNNECQDHGATQREAGTETTNLSTENRSHHTAHRTETDYGAEDIPFMSRHIAQTDDGTDCSPLLTNPITAQEAPVTCAQPLSHQSDSSPPQDNSEETQLKQPGPTSVSQASNNETPLMRIHQNPRMKLEENIQTPQQVGYLNPRMEQPKPNYDENETPLKRVQSSIKVQRPSSAEQSPVVQPPATQPPKAVQKPQNIVQHQLTIIQQPDTVQQPKNAVQPSPKTAQKQAYTLEQQQPLNTKQQLTEKPILEQMLDLVKNNPNESSPKTNHSDDEAEETPLKRPIYHDHVPHFEVKQQERQAGRQLSQERHTPSEPESLHYQTRALQELDSLPAGRLYQPQHLLSITDSLMPEEWELPATRLDKFQVTYVLDKLSWVKQYMLDEDRIDVFVDFDNFRNLTYLIIIAILKKLTLWDEIDFRVREMLPSYFAQFGLTLSPGAEVLTQGRNAAIGAYLRCAENGKYYAITAGHLYSEGESCYQLGKCIGTCVYSWSSYTSPRTIDLALIELSDSADLEIQNYIPSASGEECSLKLPASEEDVCAMECWKVQRKSRDRWQYGFLRYAVLTNKDHGLYRVVGVVRTVPQNPVVTKGDCGCLVTSLPGDKKITVFGMFVGCLMQDADTGTEERVEWYIAFPLKQALEGITSQPGLFHGKTLELVCRSDRGRSKQSLVNPPVQSSVKPTLEPSQKYQKHPLPKVRI